MASVLYLEIPDYQARVFLKAKGGQITSSKISISPDADIASAEAQTFDNTLKDKRIQDIDDFHHILNQANHQAPNEVSAISRWLNEMFGKAN